MPYYIYRVRNMHVSFTYTLLALVLFKINEYKHESRIMNVFFSYKTRNVHIISSEHKYAQQEICTCNINVFYWI